MQLVTASTLLRDPSGLQWPLLYLSSQKLSLSSLARLDPQNTRHVPSLLNSWPSASPRLGDYLLCVHQGAVRSVGLWSVLFRLASVAPEPGTEPGLDHQYYLVH